MASEQRTEPNRVFHKSQNRCYDRTERQEEKNGKG